MMYRPCASNDWSFAFSSIDDDAGCSDPKPYIIADEGNIILDFNKEEYNGDDYENNLKLVPLIVKLPEIIELLEKIQDMFNEIGIFSITSFQIQELFDEIENQQNVIVKLDKLISQLRKLIIETKNNTDESKEHLKDSIRKEIKDYCKSIGKEWFDD